MNVHVGYYSALDNAFLRCGCDVLALRSWAAMRSAQLSQEQPNSWFGFRLCFCLAFAINTSGKPPRLGINTLVC